MRSVGRRGDNHGPTEGPRRQSDFPPGLAKPARPALAAARCTRLEQFMEVREGDLLKLHGMGPQVMGLFRPALRARGLSFADPD